MGCLGLLVLGERLLGAHRRVGEPPWLKGSWRRCRDPSSGVPACHGDGEVL